MSHYEYVTRDNIQEMKDLQKIFKIKNKKKREDALSLHLKLCRDRVRQATERDIESLLKT